MRFKASMPASFGLAAAGGARGAHFAVEIEAGTQDRRVADAAGDLPGQAARRRDSADLALGAHAVAVDRAVDLLGIDETFGHHLPSRALRGVCALLRVEVVLGVDAALPLQPLAP
jgi:hypothetical protein